MTERTPTYLALVGERALKASVDLWAIENIVGTNRGKIAEWNDSTRIYRSLFTLPTLALAGEAAGTDPHTALSVDEPWSWCRFQTERIAEDLMEWVEAQDARLAVVRSCRSPVSHPIEATSDDGAVFELVHASGGRMPGEAARGPGKTDSVSKGLQESLRDATREITAQLEESRERVLAADEILVGLKNAPLIVNGAKSAIESLRIKLSECEELYAKVFEEMPETDGEPDDE